MKIGIYITNSICYLRKSVETYLFMKNMEKYY